MYLKSRAISIFIISNEGFPFNDDTPILFLTTKVQVSPETPLQKFKKLRRINSKSGLKDTDVMS